MDLLGEATTSDEQADHYARRVLDLMADLSDMVRQWPSVPIIDESSSAPVPRVNISVKLTSLEANFDPLCPDYSIPAVLERLRPILRAARKLNAFINVDMEQYRYKDLTLATFRKVLTEPEFNTFPDAGIVLQAYLTDAAHDLEDMLQWVEQRGTPIAIRLVKGAYWDYETVHAIQSGWDIPVWTEKWRTDAQYEEMARTMLDHHRQIRPALASHNVRSLASVMVYAEAREIDRRDYEIQMLLGMGDPLKTAVAEMGYALRIYTPFGQLIPGMAYLIRRLLENTSNESFLRHTFHDELEPEKLLANPEEARPKSTPLPQPTAIDPEEDAVMMPFAFEPHTDFSRAARRQAMADALERIAGQFGGEYPLVIGGKEIKTKLQVESVNPSRTKQVVGVAHFAGVEQANQAVDTARHAFEDEWQHVPAAERAGLLLNVADLMRHRRFDLASWIVFEAAKPWREADADVAEAIDFCKYYAQQIDRLTDRPRQRHFPGEDNTYLYRPRGVAVVISPWNFPLAILTGMTSAALAAGNTVIMKPAEQTPVIAARLMNMFIEAGFPPGVVNLVFGQGETVGAALVDHPHVKVIAFTGSRPVGVSIYEKAAAWKPGQPSLKRVIAEMGGKNAIVIDADADLDEAVVGVVNSACSYAGQKCSACSRAIVHHSVAEAFIERLVETTRSLIVGDASKPETLVGPLIDEDARRKVLDYIAIGRKEAHERYSADLGDLAGKGTYAPPTIFTGVAPDARIAQEEIFGPVLSVITCDSFADGLRIANATDYALTGGVYSRSPDHIALARRNFRVGNLYINRSITGALVDRQPFGGFKMSGVGSKAGGPDYLLQFMEPQTVTENTLRHGFAPDTATDDASS
jgi:RHH-type proline utilization regulon transcriptional repressor/proline dehydrogenase/delta 1-pyrroline-5-carboxylate dehydrogenase